MDSCEAGEKLLIALRMKRLCFSCLVLMSFVAALPERAQAVYLYYGTVTFSRSAEYSVMVARNELRKLGFTNPSSPKAWEQYGYNADTLVLVTNVPLSASKTYVQVLATSNTDASAKKWQNKIMEAIKNTKLTKID